MVQIKLKGFLLNQASGNIVMALQEVEGQQRIFGVNVMAHDAFFISYAANGQVPPRPLTHDFAKSLFMLAGTKVAKIIFNDVDEESRMIYASVYVVGPNQKEEREVDCHPVDAVALAVRLGTPESPYPLFVAETVLDKYATSKKSEKPPTDEELNRIEEEFKRFIRDGGQTGQA